MKIIGGVCLICCCAFLLCHYLEVVVAVVVVVVVCCFVGNHFWYWLIIAIMIFIICCESRSLVMLVFLTIKQGLNFCFAENCMMIQVIACQIIFDMFRYRIFENNKQNLSWDCFYHRFKFQWFQFEFFDLEELFFCVCCDGPCLLDETSSFCVVRMAVWLVY